MVDVTTRALCSGLRLTSCGFAGASLFERGREKFADVPNLGLIFLAGDSDSET